MAPSGRCATAPLGRCRLRTRRARLPLLRMPSPSRPASHAGQPAQKSPSRGGHLSTAAHRLFSAAAETHMPLYPEVDFEGALQRCWPRMAGTWHPSFPTHLWDSYRAPPTASKSYNGGSKEPRAAEAAQQQCQRGRGRRAPGFDAEALDGFLLCPAGRNWLFGISVAGKRAAWGVPLGRTSAAGLFARLAGSAAVL